MTSRAKRPRRQPRAKPSIFTESLSELPEVLNESEIEADELDYEEDGLFDYSNSDETDSDFTYSDVLSSSDHVSDSESDTSDSDWDD